VTPPGRLVLVVGPSGAGKDALIAGARTALSGDPRFAFIRRIITRDADTGTEDHDSMAPHTFDDAEAAGAFALSWRAHGLGYALPAGLADDIAAGRIAVANGSRHAVAQASRRFDCAVVLVTAAPALRAGRLALRGREGEAEILARLNREDAPPPDGVAALTVENEGTLEAGVAAFVTALRGLAA
jgi:ribose 1,5-bisphosphokinase